MNSQQVIHPPRRADKLAALVETIAARREEIDRLSHVPRDLVAQMKEVGIFRAGTPKCFGGDASSPADFLPMVEAIATADGSAAWVAAFGSANTYLAALPIETQRKIYETGPDQVFAGALYPVQPAKPAPGGWIATGRWRFASGCKGADWIGAGIATPSAAGDSDKPSLPRMAVAPAHEVEIVDNWEVFGMQGTGSHDIRVENKFYAEEWTFLRGSESLIDETLFRYPPLAYQAQVHAVVNIGLARAALDLVMTMSKEAKIMPGAPRLGDRGYFRLTLAKGEAQWRSIRSFFYETIEQAWDILEAGDPLPDHLSNLLRLSASHAAHGCADIIQSAYRIAGMSAIQKSHRMQQIVRDSLVVTQHASLSEATFDDIGGYLAGTGKGL
ncbi:acyl-CoA dehydrogenase family protein [Novosphingobium terrae]|uniref:acyl-CoA dehydrogenase family protein n=1 Tax=Novosphingobium terrae TaxID=2726189 RepID=UPI0019823734|nr:acyl-CoA dehydrogenase family protein [Novosphingobium terrae]